MSEVADFLAAPAPDRKPEPEKDRYGRYLIPGPDGGKAKPHTRTTTFIKAIDGGGEGLKKWFARYAVKGFAADEARLGRIATWDADPEDAETKKEFNRLLEEATVAAGINTKRDKGSALHDATEFVDAGRDYTPVAWMAKPLANYAELVAAYGLEFSESEAIIVVDALSVAGKFDRLARAPWFSGTRVLDIKTGSTDYPGSFAIQLGVYVSADAIYDPVTGERRPFPDDIDRDTGLILHLPIDGSPATLYEVDLSAALSRDLPATCLKLREWDKESKKVLTRVPFNTAEAQNCEPEPTAEPVDVATAAQKLAEHFPGIQLEPAAWVLGRLDDLKGTADGLAPLKPLWPRGVPLPGPVQRGEHTWTDGELHAIIPAVVQACEEAGLEDDPAWPFGPPDPLKRQAAEDAPADPEDAKRVRAMVRALPEHEAALIKRWVEEGAQNRTPWAFGRTPTVRRLNIARGAVSLVQKLYDPADVAESMGLIHEAITRVCGTNDPSVAVGVRLGRLSPGQAEALVTLASTAVIEFVEGKPTLAVNEGNA